MSARCDLERLKGALPSVVLTRGDAVPLEATQWLWRDYLPAGMLTVIGGAPGCGKTTVALSIAATVCPRRSNFDPPCRLNFDPGLVAGFA